MFPQFLSLIFDCSMFISGRFGRIEHEEQHSRLNHSCCCRHSCCCLDQHSRLNHSCPMVSREKIQYHLILFWIFMSICILVVYAYYLGLLCKFEFVFLIRLSFANLSRHLLPFVKLNQYLLARNNLHFLYPRFLNVFFRVDCFISQALRWKA